MYKPYNDRHHFSEEDYINKVIDLADFYGKRELLLSLYWFVEGTDPFWRQLEGLERYHCIFSLEYLFRAYLQPGWDWFPCYTYMCQEAEDTNSYMAMLSCKTRGIWKTGVPSHRRNLLEKFNSKIDLIRMWLCYRGYSKTTMFSIAHSLQECLIHPDIRLLIMSGSLDQAESIVQSIKSHFMFNDKLRAIFPEYCPLANKSGKIEFGTQSEFTLPNRTVYSFREPSVMAASPNTKLAGYHFTKHKNDDLISEESVSTPEQIKKAKNAFGLCQNLFENVSMPFLDFCGTHYHENDLYMDLKKGLTDDEGYYEYQTYNPKTQRMERRKDQI